MAKIVIAAVSNAESTYSVLFTLTETQTIEGEELPVPIGEATVTFPYDTPMDEIKKKIIKAAQGIMKSHQDAQDKRKDLDEVDWPDIPPVP